LQLHKTQSQSHQRVRVRTCARVLTEKVIVNAPCKCKPHSNDEVRTLANRYPFSLSTSHARERTVQKSTDHSLLSSQCLLSRSQSPCQTPLDAPSKTQKVKQTLREAITRKNMMPKNTITTERRHVDLATAPYWWATSAKL
jgi:hypothetical protein